MTQGLTAKVSHILAFFEKWAPQSTKLDYDNVGLLVGSPEKSVRRILTCLDITETIAEEAIDLHCDLIVAHHPLIFKPIGRITPDTDQGAALYKLIRNNISLIAVHTNLDAAAEGVSFALADQLGLVNTQFLAPGESDESTGMGAVGELPGKSGIEADDFLEMVCDRLGCNALRYSGAADIIRKVAVCGGAGVFLLDKAASSGAQAYVTADVKYHDYFHDYRNLILVDAGHYETERPVIPVMKEKLHNAFPHIEILETNIKTSPMQVHVSRISENSNHVKTNIQN